jgi:hypothetical protein
VDEKLRVYLLKIAAALLTLGGLVAVIVGWLGVRNEADVVLQVPYLASGGLGGLALVGLGAIALLWSQLREQRQRYGELLDGMEEWKASLTAELRRFLDQVEIEVEVTTKRSPRPARIARAGGRAKSPA